jgi:hypothetical protein
MAETVVRPIVRSFKARFAREAAAHVRGGGHAIVWEAPRKALLVMPVPRPEDPMDLGFWSLLDLGKSRYRVAKDGPFRHLAMARVPGDCLAIVERRAHRDSVHPGPTREVSFDCLACGACCVDNEVQLFDDDVARLRAGGRGELAKRPYARRRDGKLVLVLTRTKRCKQLGEDNRCGIYSVRPAACRDFPVASECCLFSREDALGLVDGEPSDGLFG